MKRLSTIIMALALVLGMSQCKKQETPTNGNGGEKVHITLNVSNGESLDVNVNDNGGRHAVAPNLGVIQFRNGDVLYVGHDGKYIGQLTYTNGAFGGELEPPTGEDFLHFYFLGGKAPETEIEAGTTASFNINIADQRQNLPVLCYGASTQKYTTGGSNYTAVLEYKCALVRFNLEKQVYMNVNLSNVLTEATIDFANNAITPTATTGTMTLYGEEGVITHRWGILLPGTTLTGNSDLVWQGTGSMPTIVANGYVDAGVGAGFLIHNPSLPAPSTNVAVHSGDNLSVFSVSPTQKVYFSKANLKYTPGGTWEFHNSQIDECYGQLRNGGTSSYPNYRPEQSRYGQAWVQGGGTSSMDRFCWGYNDYDNTLSETDFITGRKDLSRTFGTDWGCAFPEGTYWRTPTASEWDYLLNNTARGNKRFMMVKFLYHNKYPNSKLVYESYCNGLMLFPDNFDETGLQLSSNFNTSWYNQTDAYHLIDATDAFCDDSGSNMYKLLNAGVVFLPAVGMRAGGTDYNTNIYGSSYYYIYDYYDSEAGGVAQGYYWTASCDGYETWSKYLWIGVHGGRYYAVSNNYTTATETFGVHNTMANVPNMREIGMCVRLVWDAN